MVEARRTLADAVGAANGTVPADVYARDVGRLLSRIDEYGPDPLQKLRFAQAELERQRRASRYILAILAGAVLIALVEAVAILHLVQ